MKQKNGLEKLGLYSCYSFFMFFSCRVVELAGEIARFAEDVRCQEDITCILAIDDKRRKEEAKKVYQIRNWGIQSK
jgi:hypothetical protein